MTNPSDPGWPPASPGAPPQAPPAGRPGAGARTLAPAAVRAGSAPAAGVGLWRPGAQAAARAGARRARSSPGSSRLLGAVLSVAGTILPVTAWGDDSQPPFAILPVLDGGNPINEFSWFALEPMGVALAAIVLGLALRRPASRPATGGGGALLAFGLTTLLAFSAYALSTMLTETLRRAVRPDARAGHAGSASCPGRCCCSSPGLALRRSASSAASRAAGRRAGLSSVPMPAQPAPRITVALDGPASSGKSSVGAAAAGRARAAVRRHGPDLPGDDRDGAPRGRPARRPAGLVPLAARVTLGDDGTGRLTRVLLDGDDATDDVHTEAVDVAVSTVSSVPEVRAALLARQRALAADGGIVVAGRDIGTVVLPGRGAQGVPRRVGRRAGRPPDRRARPGPRRRRGRARPRAAPGARRPGPQPGRGAAAGGRRRGRHPDRREHVRRRPSTSWSTAIERRGGRGDGAGGAPDDRAGQARSPSRQAQSRLEAAYRLDNDQTMLVRMVALGRPDRAPGPSPTSGSRASSTSRGPAR